MRISILIICFLANHFCTAQQPFSTKKTDSGIEMVYIPAGSFLMGSSEGELKSVIAYCEQFASTQGPCSLEQLKNELPKRRVEIQKGFWIGKYEVTKFEWKKIMGSLPSTESYFLNPVDNISWSDAQEFIKKLNARNDGMIYSLPTEAQWEYAARAGTTTATSYGEHINGNNANFKHGLTLKGFDYITPLGKTIKVGSYPANAWGIHDMYGNVYEFCQDIYSPNAATLPTNGTANTKGEADTYVIRGGAFDQGEVQTRSAFRKGTLSSTRSKNYGLRITAIESRPPEGRFIGPYSSNNFAIFYVLENGVKKFGVIDKESKVIIPPKYSRIKESTNYFQVLADTTAGIIDFSGNVVVPFKYYNVVSGGKELFIGYTKTEPTQYALFNHVGKEIVPLSDYKSFKLQEDGRIKVIRSDNSFFYIDREGNEISNDITAPTTDKKDDINKWTLFIQGNTKDPDGYLKRGIAYHESQQYNLAILDFTQSIKINPDYMERNAHIWRAASYLSEKKYQLALADLNKAIEWQPPYSRLLGTLLLKRARLYCEMGKKKEAMKDEESAIELEAKVTTPCN